MEKLHLPMVTGSLRKDGSRVTIIPADVRGRFTRARRIVFAFLIAFWIALPWVPIHGHPAVFLDMQARRFYLFGATFNAQDVWLLFFLVTGVVFGLAYVTALAGRVFCGWVCPQTVFLEGCYRRIERLILGGRDEQRRRSARPWTAGDVARLSTAHLAYVFLSVLIAHVFVSYFVSLPAMFRMVRSSPSEHPEAFAWMLALTSLFYGNFVWFREQLCLIVCPYGRLQSALVDADSLVVGYDEARGEPRGKLKTEARGDCIDCRRCVAVCPTGIDIRHGLQLDCIGCTACIDACDEVMDRVNQPRGLIRYDSLNGLEGKPRRIGRPRIYLYTALMALGFVVAIVATRARSPFEANLLRATGAPYTVDGDQIRNVFDVHLVNKSPDPVTLSLTAEVAPDVTFAIPIANVRIDSLASAHAPVIAMMPRASFHHDVPLHIRIQCDPGCGTLTANGTLLGPAPTSAGGGSR